MLSFGFTVSTILNFSHDHQINLFPTRFRLTTSYAHEFSHLIAIVLILFHIGDRKKGFSIFPTRTKTFNYKCVYMRFKPMINYLWNMEEKFLAVETSFLDGSASS